MSTEQRETLDAILRQSAFPADIDVSEQRRLLRELTSAQPLAAEVTVTAAALGGVPAAEITIDGIERRHVVLYFHGGVYVLGDAFSAAGLAAQVGRRTRATVISVDYRLAPEHPYPAAADDALAAYQALLRGGTAPSDIAFAGESAGGGLAIATLVNARDHGLPLPAAAFVMSPYADLTLAGTTMDTKTIAEFRANEGRVGGNFEGAPLVLVHHRGRKSGREYVNPMMYLPHDTEPDIIYVFATRAGAPANPDWYHNLTAAGDGSVERGTETYKVTVRELTGAERDRIYAEQARRYPGFAEYARQTAGIRTIPVLELTRA